MTLLELETLLSITLIRDKQFFREWQENLPKLTELEKQQLNKVQAGYFNLLKYSPFLENVVKMTVLHPLLFIGDFNLTLYCIKSEKTIELSALDEDTIINGNLDVLVLKDQLWLIVIESQQAAFSIEAGLSQMLAYMLANLYQNKPTFGMITTGASFVFIKLIQGEQPQYATSRIFELRNPDNQLYDVIKILKHITQLVITES